MDATPAEAPVFTRQRLWWLLLLVGISALLLFARLGEYALWDDEAGTALHGQCVFATGDTGAKVGENIVAFRHGVALKGLKERSLSPLQYYLAAPFVGVWRDSAFAARFPFALCGLFTLGFLCYWILSRVRNPGYAGLLIAGYLSNVSLLLYVRQSRYYALALLFSTLVVFLYLKWSSRREYPLLFSLCCLLLMASNYLAYAALGGAMAVDFLIWRRKQVIPSRKAIVVFAVTQSAAALLLLSVWNPFRSGLGSFAREHGPAFAERLLLFLWNLRDAAAAEFYHGFVLLAALWLVFRRRDQLLARALCALLVFLTLVTVFSPQADIFTTKRADIRYILPAILLFIFVTARTLFLLFGNTKALLAGMALLEFGTNALNGIPLLDGGFHSLPVSYLGELLDPPGDPYRPTSDWIRKNVPPGSSVWVQPEYMTHPLVFHAPDAVYAWQLLPGQRAEEQFKDLPPIHFKGVEMPDYIVVFGPLVSEVRRQIAEWKLHGTYYREVGMIDCYWNDLYRPEAFQRTFRPIKSYDWSTQAIYLFKKHETTQ